MIQKVLHEHRAAFVERIWLKLATPALPGHTPAESPSGLLNNHAGRECVAPLQNTNQQTVWINFAATLAQEKCEHQKVRRHDTPRRVHQNLTTHWWPSAAPQWTPPAASDIALKNAIAGNP